MSKYVSITLPGELVNKALEKGIDLGELVITILIEKLDLNLSEVAKFSTELAEKFLS